MNKHLFVLEYFFVSRGLGLDRLFMKFLKLHSDPRNLVLVIGSSTLYEVNIIY